MGRIGPNVTHAHLANSVQQTIKGEGLIAGLPGVEADAQRMDNEAHRANRELAKRISAAVAAAKPSDDGVPRFVLGWRLYPNRDNAFWKDAGGVHNCGCGCACFSQPSDEPDPQP